MGMTEAEIKAPFVGVATTWNEGRALQHHAGAPGPGGEEGRQGGGRHAARVSPPSP